MGVYLHPALQFTLILYVRPPLANSCTANHLRDLYQAQKATPQKDFLSSRCTVGICTYYTSGYCKKEWRHEFS